MGQLLLLLLLLQFCITLRWRCTNQFLVLKNKYVLIVFEASLSQNRGIFFLQKQKLQVGLNLSTRGNRFCFSHISYFRLFSVSLKIPVLGKKGGEAPQAKDTQKTK